MSYFAAEAGAAVPPWILGVSALVIFLLLLGAAYAFRNQGSKH